MSEGAFYQRIIFLFIYVLEKARGGECGVMKLLCSWEARDCII
jgi:hypothetical protein